MTNGMMLESGLWIDAPDVVDQIGRREAAGTITPAQAAGLRHFAERGFLVIDLARGVELADALLAGVEDLWRERPADVAYAYDSPPRRLSVAEPSLHRRPKHRLHDIHSHLEAARVLRRVGAGGPAGDALDGARRRLVALPVEDRDVVGRDEAVGGGGAGGFEPAAGVAGTAKWTGAGVSHCCRKRSFAGAKTGSGEPDMKIQ